MGQDVSDTNQQEIARVLACLEPASPVETHVLPIRGSDRGVNLLRAPRSAAGPEMTVPDKPRSSKQRYRITAAGKRILHKVEREE